MTKEQIYNTICDLAEDIGVSTEELVSALVQQGNAKFEEALGAMPADAAEYVKSARAEKLAAREGRRQAEADGQLSEEIQRFRKAFPDVAAEDIPQSVWEDMRNGIPLTYAYAMFLQANGKDTDYADEVNARNSSSATPPVSEGADEGELSMEEVESMSPAAVKSNFPRILRSIGKWKL